jgi:phospholipid/cholesterol/gamma-HCH transport system substrate-binding protein
MAEVTPANHAQNEDPQDEIVTVAISPYAWIRITVLIGSASAMLLFLVYLLSGSIQDLFERRAIIVTYLPDVTGITKKDKVEIDGIPVGEVRSVSLSGSNEPSRVAYVELAVLHRYLSAIPVDSKVEVTADNLLGDKYINIHKGVGHEYVKPGDELLVQPPNVNFDAADLIASMETILKRANLILDQIDDPESALGEIFQSEDTYVRLLDSITGIQKAIHSYTNPKSAAGQALFGTELYDELRNPVLDLDKLLASIQNGEGEIGHALATSEQYDQLRDGMAAFHRSAVELRKNRYLSSDEDYKKIHNALTNLSGVIDAITAQPAFTNAQLYESLNGQSSSAAKALSDFRQNPQKYLRIKVF